MAKVNRIFIGIVLTLAIGSIIFLYSDFNDRTDLSMQYTQSSGYESEVCNAPEYAIVTNVVDRDTVIVEGGHWVRLLYMNADEKEEPCYGVAKNRLKELVLGKKVRLQRDISDLDKYGRCLRTIFMGEENVNLNLVKEGQALAAFYEPDVKYRQEMLEAQEYAKSNSIGCEWEQFYYK